MGQFFENVGLWISYYVGIIGDWIGYLWNPIRTWLLVAPDPAHKFALMVVAIVLFVVVMGAILLAVDRPKRVPQWVVPMAFLGPTILALAFGLLYPGLRTIWASLLDSKGREYVGLQNYVTAFTEPQFQLVLRNTFAWIVLVPILATIIGLVYAVLVDRTRFEYIAKTLIFLPMAISLVGASIIWKFVYQYREYQESSTGGVIGNQIGLLNQVVVWIRQGLDTIGIHTSLKTFDFMLNSPENNFFLIVVMIWIQAGFAMTVLSAAIKAIPDDIVEAARLDGLYGFKMFRLITVPSIRPALIVVLTTIAMGTLKVFDIVRTMTAGNFGTQVVANEFYNQSFRYRDAGLGSALAVLLFVIVIPLVVYNVRQLRISEEVR